MQRSIHFSLIFSFILPIFFCQKLEFLKDPKDSGNSQIYLSDIDSSEIIDASFKSHRQVYLVAKYDYVITNLLFSCYGSSEVDQVKICHRKTPSDEKNCLDKEAFTPPFELIKIVNYDPKKGFQMNFTKPVKSSVKLSGLYSCKLGKNGSFIESNEFQLHDVPIHLIEPNQHNPVKKEPIRKSDMPIKLSCDKPKEASEYDNIIYMSDRIRPFSYYLCDLRENDNQMKCKKNSVRVNSSVGFLDSEGNLYVTNKNILLSGHYSIICKNIKDDAYKSFVGGFNETSLTAGLTFDSVSSDPYQLENVSSLKKTVEFFEGYNMTGKTLLAIYKKPNAPLEFEWFKDNEKLNDCTCTENKLEFNEPIKFSDAGKYRLKVTNQENFNDNIEFEFDLVVKGPPKFNDDCIPKKGYVISNEPLWIDCRAHEYAQYGAGIDSFEAYSIADLRTKLRQLNDSRSKLDVDFHEGGSRQSLGLKISNIDENLDFDVVVRAKNELGEVINSGNVKTMPFPKSTSVPLSKFQCSDNCMNETVNLEYTIDEKILEKLNSMNIKYDQDWIINDKLVLGELMEENKEDKLFKFIEFNPEDKTKVTILREDDDGLLDTMKIKEKKNLENLLAKRLDDPNLEKLTIASRIRYYIDNEDESQVITPKLKGKSVIKNFDGKDYRLIYDTSESTKKTEHNLQAMRYFQQPPTQASLSWIAALILGILALIIITAVVVYICKKKNKKTYTPRNEEIRHGMSPDDDYVDGRHLLPKEDTVTLQADGVIDQDVDDLNNRESDLSIAEWTNNIHTSRN